jgi:hypothetical protein
MQTTASSHSASCLSSSPVMLPVQRRCPSLSVSGCRAKAGMNAAADGKLAAKSNNPFSAPGTDNAGSAPAEASQGAVDEADIEAEGIESALVSLERVTAMLTLNCIQGVSPGMKVCSHCHVCPIVKLGP